MQLKTGPEQRELSTVSSKMWAGRSTPLLCTAATTVFAVTCFAQIQDQLCRDARAVAWKFATTVGSDLRASATEFSPGGRQCASRGYVVLAEEAFERGRLSDASRYISVATQLAEREPQDAKLLLGALRVQGAIYIERGMLKEALATVEHLKVLPGESPEQHAVVRGLAGACYQSAGEVHKAEREYVLAIQAWDRMQRSEHSVSDRSNLGVVYLALRRFEEAVVVLERGKTLITGSGKTAAMYRLVITNNLAVAYSERGDTARAVRHAREAARLADVAKVGRYQLVANVYSNSASILGAAGYKSEANESEHRAARAEAMADSLVDVSKLPGGK